MDGHFGVMIVSNTVDIVKYWIILCRLNTGESWFFEPLRELKIGSKNQIVGEIGDEIVVFQWGAEGETTFGLSYQEVKKKWGFEKLGFYCISEYPGLLK